MLWQVRLMYFPDTFDLPLMDLLVQRAVTHQRLTRPFRGRSSCCRLLRSAAALPAFTVIQRLLVYGSAGES